MASVVFKNAQVLLVTTTEDISDHVTRIRLNRTYDLHDDTRMGMTDHSRISGLGTWAFEFEVLQDFQSTGGAIDKILNRIAAAGVPIKIAVRPYKGVDRSSDNPEYSGDAILESYTPMDGAVGDLLKTTVPFQSAGSLTRTVSTS
jgi:hypothetical protein